MPRARRWLRLLPVVAVLFAHDAAGAGYALDQLPYPPRAPEPRVTVLAYRDGAPLATVGARTLLPRGAGLFATNAGPNGLVLAAVGPSWRPPASPPTGWTPSRCGW